MSVIEEIKKLKKERNAVILAHYYVTAKCSKLRIILGIPFI